MGGSPTGRNPNTRLRVSGNRSSALKTATLEPMSWSSSEHPVRVPVGADLAHSLLMSEPAV